MYIIIHKQMLNFKQIYSVTLTDIFAIKNELLTFSEMTAFDVHNIWLNDPDQFMPSHMANRFKNVGLSDPCIFFATFHPDSKKILINEYMLHSNKITAIMEFFKYLKCSLGTYHFKTLFNDENILNLWRTLTSASFFFSLSLDHQQILIDHYNKNAY